MRRRESLDGSRQIHQTITNGVNDELRGFVNAECIHNVGAVDRYGIHAEIQARSDFLVRLACNDVLENLQLAGR